MFGRLDLYWQSLFKDTAEPTKKKKKKENEITGEKNISGKSSREWRQARLFGCQYQTKKGFWSNQREVDRLAEEQFSFALNHSGSSCLVQTELD